LAEKTSFPEQEMTVGDRPSSAAEAFGVIERCSLLVNLVLLALSSALIVTFWLGKVSPIPLAAIGLPLISIPAYFIFLRTNFLRWNFTKNAKVFGYLVILGILIAGGLYLRYPTSAYIHGGQDQGSYFNIAAWMARNGTYDRYDKILADASNQNRPLASRLAPNPFTNKGAQQELIPGEYEGERFVGGFFIKDRKKGHVIPQFYPLTPLLLTTSYWIFGAEGTGDILPIFGVLAALGTALLAFRIWKNLFVTALVLVTLLVSGLEVFFSGFPLSEIISQYFIISGMWLLSWGIINHRYSLTLLAGMNFAVALFNHLSVIFYLAPITLFFVLHRMACHDRVDKKTIFVFYYTFLAGSVISLISARIYNGYYVYRNLEGRLPFLEPLEINEIFLLLFAVVFIAALFPLVFYIKSANRLENRPLWVTRSLVVATAVIALLIIAKTCLYKFDMISLGEIKYTYFSSITTHISPLGWLFLLWGLFAAIFASRITLIVFPVSALLFHAFLFLYLAFRTDYQWYFNRYYVKEFYPLAIMFTAYGIYYLSRLGMLKGIKGKLVMGVLGLVLVVYSFYPNVYLFKHPFLNGAYEDVLSLNSKLPDNSIILFIRGHRGPFTLEDSENRLGVPLVYSLGHDVIRLPFRQNLAKMVDAVKTHLTVYQRPIYLLYIGTQPLRAGLLPNSAKLIASHLHTFTQPELVYHIPRKHSVFRIGTHLYAL